MAEPGFEKVSGVYPTGDDPTGVNVGDVKRVPAEDDVEDVELSVEPLVETLFIVLVVSALFVAAFADVGFSGVRSSPTISQDLPLPAA